ncbi:MAG TPA: hypothetical protein DEG47_05505, partial [Cyanobacteria bacterium UBA11148]|nr:hypothetical protein [Cyanobacteria bacterium UBA11148]
MTSEVFLILLVVDDEANYRLICELLNPIKTIQVELDWVTTESAALEAISERSYDAYLIDAQLLQLSSNNRQHPWLKQGKTVPVIWLTDTPETGITALASGAADYLVYAQLSSPLLERSLRLTIAYARSQYQRKAGKSQHQTQLDKANPTPINRKKVRYLCNDFSECKHAESAIKRANAQLEQRVRERTAELQRINQELTQEIQERQRVENALRDSEERFRQLAENISSVFWMVKPDLSELLYVSPMYEEIWGRSCESFYQNPYSWLDTIHPSDRTSVEMEVAQVIQSDYHQGQLDIQYRIVRPDGSIRWIHARAFPIRNQAGNVYRVAGISEDITDKKRVEEELHQNQLFTETIANTSPQLLYLYDLITGANLYVNQQSVEILGYTPEEIRQTGANFFLDTIHPDDLLLVKELSNHFATLADHEVVEQEYRIRHKNGSWRWLRSRDIIFRRCANGLPEQILGCAIDITAHKEIEFQLRESESRLSTIVNSISDGILIVDQQGIVEFANPAAEKLFNQPFKNLLNHEFGLPIVVGETAELGIVRPGGKLGMGEMSIAKTKWQGEPVYVVSLRDITERRQAEEALRESEERFRQLADNIQDVFWLFEPSSNQILYVSPPYEQVWGGSIGNLYIDFNNWLDTIHSDDQESVLDKISKYPQGELITQDYRIVRPDGEIRWICDRAFPIKNEWGEVIRVAGIAEDITDRKRTEDELQQYRDRLQVLVEQRTTQLLAANQTLQQEIAERQKAESAIRFQARLLEVVEHAIIATDVSGCITFWNRFAETLYGWSAREVLGRNIIDVTPSKISQAQATEIMSSLNQGKSWSGEFWVQRRDGTSFPALVTDSPIYDEEEQLIGIVGISVDISERKQLEKALRKANAELGITVEERTKDLGSAIERLQHEIVQRKQIEADLRTSEVRYRAIVEDQVELVCRFQLDSILTFVNDSYCSYFGKTREELIGSSLLNLVAPEEQEWSDQKMALFYQELPKFTIAEHRV